MIKLLRKTARSVALLTAFAAPILASGALKAQTWPDRTIRIVVGTAPSTPTDIVSRIIAGELQKSEGWTVIVENKPGAVNTIGARDVAQAPADGYSIFAASMPITAARALLPSSQIDMVRDFAPVIKASVSYNVLVTKPTLAVNSMKELVDLLKKNPGKLNYASGGHGTPAHLVGELFKLDTKVDVAHVPYQQLPQAIQDVMGGSNDYMFVTTLPVVDLVANGNLKALAVTSSKPLPAFKGVPTVGEQGFPELAVTDWVGFLMRQGTSPAVVAKVNAAVNKALQSPTVRETLQRIGADVQGGTPAEFGAFVKAQVEQWEGVVKQANIKLQ
jgi:tripartite-type tricarboxylate transporter receptor subunit TctC